MSHSFTYKVLNRLFNFLGNLSLKNRLRVGAFLNFIAPLVMKRRIAIVKKNFELSFPEATQAQRTEWQKQHIRALCQSIVDRGFIWYGDEEKIKQQVNLKNFHHLQEAMDNKEPIILLAPHFVGLDVAASRMTMIVPESATIYTAQRQPDIDKIIRDGRARFNKVHLIERKDGVRGMLRYLKQGFPVYYLPDMDFGRKGSIFVPFFDIPVATLPTTAVLAEKWGATIIPIYSYWDRQTGHYEVEVLPPLENFPGDRTVEEATTYVNELIEDLILRDPSQYYWVHRRFKTRPNPDEPTYYQ
ncbi:MAG: lysophospholipid acyltransferase family protein [Oligella ureolytica]|nr:lysophospholipid acyltransferase family protein [Oligella ureolytica]